MIPASVVIAFISVIYVAVNAWLVWVYDYQRVVVPPRLSLFFKTMLSFVLVLCGLTVCFKNKNTPLILFLCLVAVAIAVNFFWLFLMLLFFRLLLPLGEALREGLRGLSRD
jgi:hypothetical protein